MRSMRWSGEASSCMVRDFSFQDARLTPERFVMVSAHSNIHRLRPRLRLVIDNADRKPSLDPSSVADGSPSALRTTIRLHIRREPRPLAKEALLTIEGVIDEILPDGRFGVTLENDLRIICYTAGKMRRYRIRSIVGDRVHVEMTPYDLSKGRIVYREKIAGQTGGPRRRHFRR